jgi:N-acetylglucosaminyl-diphospho-decaprenol L-rhamnosyltransferase
MSIGIVVVTHNSERVLPACLKSLPRGCDVVVVDNASADASADIARSSGASVLVNRQNLGFGTACNQGARLLKTSHVLFLNPDATLAPEALSELEKTIELYPDAGGFGLAVEDLGKRQKYRSVSFIQSQGRPFPKESPPTQIAEVDFLDGAAFACDLQMFLDLGGFDEDIFLYFEDDDLCFRIRDRNRKLLYVPSAHVLHERNGSSGKKLRLDYFRSFHATKSRILVSEKHNIPLDLRGERRRGAVHLLRGLATLNIRKAAKSLGVLSALMSRTKTASGASPAS